MRCAGRTSFLLEIGEGSCYNGGVRKEGENMKLKRPTRQQVKRFIIYVLIVCVGNAMSAAASALFIIPNDFVMGGVTGIGILIRNLVSQEQEWIVEVTVYAVNGIFFIIGAILLGKKFALATLAGTLLYPTFLTVFTQLNALYVQSYGHAIAADDPMLAVCIGSLLFGAGIGIVVRIGASTGGTDIPALIAHKYLGVHVSVALWVLDGVIILLQIIAVSFEAVLYGIVINVLSSVALEVVSPIGTRRSQIFIVSRKFHEIRDMIIKELNRGVTILHGETGYLHEGCRIIMTVVSQREVVRLKNEVQKIDPEAFITISSASEVRGRGFTEAQVMLPPVADEDAAPAPPSEVEKKDCE